MSDFTRITWFFGWTCQLLALGPISPQTQCHLAFGQETESSPGTEQTKVLTEIRAAMAGQDLATAKAKLGEAKNIDTTTEFVDQAERLQLLWLRR